MGATGQYASAKMGCRNVCDQWYRIRRGVDHDQMWAYDPVVDSWTAKASIPGISRKQPMAFSINGKRYIGCGINGTSNFLDDLWEYDPLTDSWTQKTPFPYGARYNTWQFVINGMAYVGGGNSVGASGPFHTATYVYEPSSDTWSTGVPIPDQGRHGAIGFALNGIGYVACGRESSLGFVQDLWSFDPVAQTWTSMAAFSGAGRSSPMVFTYYNDVVIGCGRDGSTNYYDAWLYRPWNDTWMAMPDYPGATAMAGSSFSIGNRAFGGLGWDLSTGLSHSDLWELVKPDGVSIDGSIDEAIMASIYPNPVHIGEHIQFRTSSHGKGRLRILDTKGSLVLDLDLMGTGRSISTAGLTPAKYVAQWSIGDRMGTLEFVVVGH